jgi:hypothetical protein
MGGSSVVRAIALTEAARSLAEVETRFNLHRAEDEQFFSEWQQDLPELTDAERAKLQILRQRLLSHGGASNLLEGSVMLPVASLLLELPGFYDPPFRMQAEAGVEVTIADGQEILRGRIDVLFIKLVLQPEPPYSLSRGFSLYTLTQEWQAALQVLKKLAALIAE